MIILHKFCVLILLLICFVGMCNGRDCKINGDVEYLKTAPLVALHSEDRNIVLPTPYFDYSIPDISSIITGKREKIGEELNICPPVKLVE